MSKSDFIKLLRKPLPVFVNVKLTASDCWYVQAVKSNLLAVLENHDPATVYEVVERENAIYID